ncbi:MAG TPA: glycosyltransferase family 39 protein [Pyrinomonadaceae bacterium]|nr:glycosyltransferase family 39 protein [Pyrinomonadaceae bacterium]
MSASVTTVTTARIRPELFPEQIVRTSSRTLLVAALASVILFGFALRAYRLGAESLGEDELNKVRAVEEYRARGLTSANGEHPLLMKGLQTVSVVAADRWNATSFVRARPSLAVSTETAVRLPGVLLGAFTSLLIFLVAAELFGAEIGFIAAALWALDPAAIGFNRIAKEDSFLLFFFLLANVFWLRGQRVAEKGEARPERYYWAAAAAFGAMMASKYMPHYLAISASYYYIFQGVRATRWRMGKTRWLIFFAVMGVAFLVCNPTILLPGTWHEMRVFAGERRIGHDSYEYMGELYRNQMTLWLKGVPWHFYYVFMGVKLPLLTLVAFIVGLPLVFMRRMGDGRYFVLFWMFYWFFPFPLMGGKFTRYFTFALPVVLIVSAVGLHAFAQLLTRMAARLFAGDAFKPYARALVALVVLALSAYASVRAAPHYRLYTNALGGGERGSGTFFPHDEFYDGAMREIAGAVAREARTQARVASETPELFSFYARRAGREDLRSVSLSDAAALREFEPGDFIVVARGRRYFSNEAVVAALASRAQPLAEVSLGKIPAARVFLLDEASREAISAVLKQ